MRHQVHARGGAQGSGYRRKDGNDEMDDFLDDFFLVHGSGMVEWLVSFCNQSPPWKGARGMLTLHSFISSERKT